MEKTLHLISLKKSEDHLSFVVTKAKVLHEDENIVKAWKEDSRHSDSGISIEKKKSELDKVRPLPFGQTMNNMMVYGYTLDETNVLPLKKEMLRFVEEKLNEIKSNLLHTESVVAEFKKDTFGA